MRHRRAGRDPLGHRLIDVEPRLLRAVEGLAVQVAFDGELADPPQPAPAELKPILRFRKLSAATRTTIRRVLDGDEAFRARVAAVAVEDDVGRVGWLWLHRPDGWLEEIEAAVEVDAPDEAPGTGRLRRALAGAEAAATRHRVEAEDAVAARVRAEERATAAEAARAEADAALAERTAEVEHLREDRSRVVRELKAVEAERDDLRRELKRARMATREAEAELAEVRAAADPVVGPTAGAAAAPDALGPEVDRVAAERALAEVRAAVEALSASVDDAAAALGGGLGPDDHAAGSRRSSVDRAARGDRSGRAGRGRRGGQARRRRPELPMGVRTGTVEAARHLLTRPEVLVVVDGYNLARAAWDGLAPEEERRRTVAMLEEVQGRRGGEVVVVFDGDDTCVAPAASRWVRVRFSATGVTADDVIVDLVESTTDRPVVVVTSDREVVDQVEARGAATISSPTFLDARP